MQHKQKHRLKPLSHTHTHNQISPRLLYGFGLNMLVPVSACECMWARVIACECVWARVFPQVVVDENEEEERLCWQYHGEQAHMP